MLCRPHTRLSAKPQSAQPAMRGPLDDGKQQVPPDALSLSRRGDRERADIRLGVIPRELACLPEWLERDRPEDAAVRIIDGDKHGAVAAEPESPQGLGVSAAIGQQSQCLVSRDPQLADHRLLAWPCFPNNHVQHDTNARTKPAGVGWPPDRRPSLSLSRA